MFISADRQLQVTIFVDGCSIPNPGRTGCGIVIPNILEIARYLGDGSNQTAELHALREALLLAGAGDLILSDSLYAVRIVTGRWRAKAHRDLVNEIRKLVTPGVRIRWIKGHDGKQWHDRADALAKRAALKRADFEYKYPVDDDDASAGNRPEGKIAPITARSAVGKCL